MAMGAMCRPDTMVTMMTISTPTSFSCAPNCNVFRPCAGFRISLKSAISQNHCNEILQQQIRISGGKRTTRSSRSVVRAGLPVVSSIPVVGPLANAIFNPVLLFIVYAAGAYRFYSGFQRTTYDNSPTTKLSMTALWPGISDQFEEYEYNWRHKLTTQGAVHIFYCCVEKLMDLMCVGLANLCEPVNEIMRFSREQLGFFCIDEQDVAELQTDFVQPTAVPEELVHLLGNDPEANLFPNLANFGGGMYSTPTNLMRDKGSEYWNIATDATTEEKFQDLLLFFQAKVDRS